MIISKYNKVIFVYITQYYRKGLYMRKKGKRKAWIIFVLLVTLVILIASGILPHYLATGIAIIHMSSLSDGEDYHYVMTEYSSAHDAYFVHFISDTNQERRLGLYHRYVPTHVFYDSDYPG